MNPFFHAGAAALDTHMRVQESIAFNIANLNTPGFKRRVNGVFNLSPSFQEVFKRTRSQFDLPKVETAVDFSQGDLRPTTNPLDLALEGEGFFKVRTPEGIRYTRNGSFQVDGSGRLVTSSGHPVALKETGAPLVEGAIEVDKEGSISQGEVKVGKLDVVDIDDPRRLVAEGAGLFRSEGRTEIPSAALVRQGHLEGANVNPVEEFIGMISVGRNFDSVSRLLRAVDDSVRKTLER